MLAEGILLIVREYFGRRCSRRGFLIRASWEWGEYIIYNGDDWRRVFCGCGFYRRKPPNIFQSEELKAILKPSGRWSGDYDWTYCLFTHYRVDGYKVTSYWRCDGHVNDGDTYEMPARPRIRYCLDWSLASRGSISDYSKRLELNQKQAK